MAFKSYSQIIEERNNTLAKICQVYLMAAPNEQCLRFMWAFCKALFQDRYVGKLVELEKAKDRAKVRLGIMEPLHDTSGEPGEPGEPGILSDQQNFEGAEMEGAINEASNL